MLSFWKMGLRQKIVLPAVFCFLVIAGTLGYFGLEAVRESTDRAMGDRLAAAERIASQLDQRLIQMQQAIDGSSRAALVYLNSPGADPSVVEGFFEWLKPFVGHVHLLDSKGNLLWQTPSDAEDDPHHDALLRQASTSVSITVASSDSGDQQVGLTGRLLAEDGSVLGFVDAALELSWLVSPGVFDSQRLGDFGYIQVFAKDGSVLAGSQGWDHQEETVYRDRFAGLIDRAQPAVTTCHRCHETEAGVSREKEVLAFAPLKSVPWGVGFRQPRDEAFSVSRDLQRRFFLFALPALGVIFGIAFLASRSILRPIRQLTIGAERIAGGNLDEPLHYQRWGEDELGHLSRTFEGMRIRLRASYEEVEAKNREIERWNRELEEKVDERTRELRALFEVSKTLAYGPDLDSVLRPALRQILDWHQKSEGAILFLRERSGQLTPAASSFGDTVHPSEARLQALQQAASDAIDDIAPQSLRVLKEVPDLVDMPAQGGGSPVLRDVVFLPCDSNEQRIGVLVVLAAAGQGGFAPADLVGLQAFADLMAVAVQKHRLAAAAGQAEALRQADALKSEFISVVSHELRTPLASIKGFASTLLQEDVLWDASAQRDFVATINQEADRLTHMVNELLDMSRIEGGALRIDRDWFSFGELVEDVTDRLSGVTRGHHLRVDLKGPGMVVFADGARLEQVLTNLITNAVHFSANGAEIGIVAERNEDGSLQVCVSDQGVGIPAEHMDKIFDRFYRVGDGRVRGTGGVGLGLSICRGIVEAHGGKIWAVSKPGAGSKFYFTIPIVTGSEVSDETNPRSGGR